MSDWNMTDAPDEGSLDVVNVPLLLAQAWRDERSGMLRLAHGKNHRRLEIRNGAPVSIESDQTEDTFARFLEDTNQISTTDRLAVERMASERDCPHASAVLALKLLDPKALYQAMRAESRRRIAETFEWQAGFYRWTDSLPEENPAAKPHDILALLQEHLPQRWGTDRLFQSLMSAQEVYGDISPRYQKVARRLASTGELAARAIERLNGSVPIGRALGECAGDPLAAATLWIALHGGVLRVTETVSSDSVEAAPLEFEVQVVADPSARKGKTSNTTTRDTSAQGDKGEAIANALRQEIETLHGQLSSLDHYGALGLEADAGPTQFKKAYFKAAKKYHPDALARLGLDDVKESAAQVFARIAEAFETLSDPDKKAAYDAGGSEEPEIDTARLAQAETSFRKGEILIKMGNFDGALEYLEPAVDLWPEEPAYQAGLAWALHKQTHPDLERAVHHFEIALGQAPDDALIHYRLGLIMRSCGQTNRANELMARARAIDPSIEE